MMPAEIPDRRALGRAAEELAARFLVLEGYTILARNRRCAGVELDVVARQGDLLVLVEVKLRRGDLVPATRALGFRQWDRQRRAARAFLDRAPWAAAVRLDLVSVDWRPGELRLQHLCGVVPV
jgi:putative endonuclease